MWEREKMLVTSNFAFSQCLQNDCIAETSLRNQGLLGKGFKADKKLNLDLHC